MEREPYNVPFEEDFDPCPYSDWGVATACGSRRRIAQLTYDEAGNPFHIGFLCDNKHRHKWRNRGYWIPRDVFAPEGDYPEMFPASVLPPESKRTVTFEIKAAVAFAHRQAKLCIICDTPPFPRERSRQDLFLWLEKHRPELFLNDLVRPIQAYFKGKTSYDDGWYSALGPNLRTRIEKEIADSKMTADHAIPKKILEEIRAELNSDEREVATGQFTFPVCVRCNRDKLMQLEELDILSARYAKFRGEELTAVTRREEWAQIVSLYQKARRHVNRRATETG